MALTDVSARNAKPKSKAYKMADSMGLYLFVTPTGGRLWRMKYRVHGIERKMSFGSYPDVDLKLARRRCAEARGAIAQGDDPAAIKRQFKATEQIAARTTFRLVAGDYIAKTEREGRADATVSKSRWVLDLLTPAIGHRPISKVQPHELLAVLQKMERRGNLETAKRTRAFSSRVFRYAVATQRASSDPADLLRGALTAPKRKHLGAIVDAKRAGELMRAIDGYDGQPVTQYALQLSPHVFVRPGELRRAEWSEIDFDAAVWTIDSEKMKGRVAHTVPLSRQSVELLLQVRNFTGDGRYVFPSLRTPREPMSENTINGALRRLGFSGAEMTAHGFRAMASTLLNESGKWSSDAIERSLAHKDKDSVRAAYHRGAHWQERVQMAQWWSDYLDLLRMGGAVIPFNAARRI